MRRSRRTALLPAALLPAGLLSLGLLAAVPVLPAPAPAQAQELTQSPAAAKSGTYALDPAHAKVLFSVRHLGFSTYYGAFPKLEGTLVLDAANPARSKVDITIDVAAVDTSDAELDKHLRSADFLDTGNAPKATFRSRQVEMTGERTARITGDLTLRNVTRPVVLEATFNQAGPNPISKAYSIGFDAETVIRRSEWGVSAYVPAVGDEVTLRIGAEFKLQP